MNSSIGKKLRAHDIAAEHAIRAVGDTLKAGEEFASKRDQETAVAVAQVAATTAVAVNIRSLTAHLIAGLSDAPTPDIPDQHPSELAEALEALHNRIVFDSRDWAETRADAWIYGLVVGWDGPEDAMDELATRYDWSPDTVTRLRRLHTAINRARRSDEEAD